MIPSESLFSHLPCGFGDTCDRSYCRYHHDRTAAPAQQNSHVTNNYAEPQVQHNDPVNMPAGTPNDILTIQQNEETYDEFAYQGYMAHGGQAPSGSDTPLYQPFVADHTTESGEEDMGQFMPVRPEYVPKPVNKPVDKKKHHGYSALDDKPSIPVDLGNDEILMGLSSMRKKPTKRRDPLPSTTTINLKKPRISSSTKKPSRPSSTITPARPSSTITPARPSSTITPARPSSTITPAHPPTTKAPLHHPVSSRFPATTKASSSSKAKWSLNQRGPVATTITPLMTTAPSLSSNGTNGLIDTPQNKYAPLDAKPPAPTKLANDELLSDLSSTPARPARDLSMMHPNPPKNRVALPTTTTPSAQKPHSSSFVKTPHHQLLSRLSAITKPSASSSSSSKWDINKSGATTKTTSTTLPKKQIQRFAHAPQTLQLVPLDKYNGKIPFANRIHCLKKLHEEFLKHPEVSPDQAVQMAQQEEKLLLDKSQTSTGYTSSLAGVVRGIRNKQFTLPAINSQGVVSKPTTTITETMQKQRQSDGKQFTEEQFYRMLREKHTMTAEQLQKNGYPVMIKDTDGQKHVVIESSSQKSLFSEDDDLRRACCRCGAEFRLKPDGSFVSSQDCIFHWKRAFKKRINRAMESRYACCDSDITVKGCVVSEHHVHDTMRRSVLKQFVRTPPPTGPDDPRSKRVYAIDCEMVYSTWGMSVARLTVVDWNDKMVLDMLIRPDEAILDCNTRFSGLTPEVLEKAEYNLDKAQKKFFELANSETILIGHSLESDLKALRLIHRRVVDTSVVFPHRLGPPLKRALRNLASDYLQKIIQEDVEGHDSKEDSSTCMLLMLKKVREDMV